MVYKSYNILFNDDIKTLGEFPVLWLFNQKSLCWINFKNVLQASCWVQKQTDPFFSIALMRVIFITLSLLFFWGVLYRFCFFVSLKLFVEMHKRWVFYIILLSFYGWFTISFKSKCKYYKKLFIYSFSLFYFLFSSVDVP